MSDKGITLEGLAAAVDALRQELATWKALARKQDALTAAQITATLSGATTAKIDQIAVNTAAIQSLAAQVAGQIALEYVTTLPATGEPLTLYLVPQGDGTAPNYCNEYLWVNNAWELIGTTGAMANNGELTIQVNGVAVGTFTANQAANAAVNITVPTNTNQLTNGAGYVDAAALQAALTLKQNSLNTAQLEAVNSGITAAAVQQIADNATAIAGKQDALTTAQQAAVDSGATVAKIDQIATNASAIVSLTSSKQDALSTTQLAAVNSGVTAAAVQQIGTNTTDIATKAADSEVVHLAGAETITGDKTFTGAVVTHHITPETDGTYALGTNNLRWQRINTGSIYNWGSYIFNTGITAAAQGTQSTALNYNILNVITSDSSPLSFCFQSLSLSNTLTQHSLNLRLFDSNGALVAAESLLYRLTSSGLSVYPLTSGQDNLGTSSNKWKTLNGINPGALSLPRTGTTANTDYIDVSGNVDLTTTSVQNLTASATGWLCLSFAYNKVTSCQLSAGNYRTQTGPLGTSGYVGCAVPVTAGQTVNIRVDATALYSARIYLCQGNV